ncbi:DUF4064 domain-containing protein [Staphylococcus pettenkoferi]|uniref:DUF4064 domain-containing protein n=1 Tax=Staphylococcus pettenkoferi TaxID=170573 RepID=A0ABT4BNS8_9STAP|nr:DUF4064 domain-containing protein [Staphylococcus pettenkoferi]MCY1565664.1 DUF4064 domain-containing protein [Staphylococcus pettenkoferi]MCY1572788.1 DUF4064 domain-containing protein [Staphylococcus pettenkoferi]MCY1584346.1 DUF4064 domain-containing protein [Staphylococcus pettenkoferi]MCY1593594.1 DUF4064 domain-containing protein [Staphylococcus pettenkoferi]MCY1600586.1 DUF4064 domain-containing protein [Staphylococcus pettenkoferi]
MEKLIKVTSLIGVIIQSFLTLLFLLFLTLSATGVIQPDLITTVNGKETVQSPETAQSTFVTVFAIFFVTSLVSNLLGILAMKNLFENNKMSGMLHIVGAVISANLLTFIAWLISGISILRYNKKREEVL